MPNFFERDLATTPMMVWERDPWGRLTPMMDNLMVEVVRRFEPTDERPARYIVRMVSSGQVRVRHSNGREARYTRGDEWDASLTDYSPVRSR